MRKLIKHFIDYGYLLREIKDEVLKIPTHSTSDDGIMDVDFEDPLF